MFSIFSGISSRRFLSATAVVAVIGAACARDNQKKTSEAAPVPSPAPQAQPAVEEAAPAAQDTEKKQSDRQLTVFYFHTTQRCYSCNMIEKLTKEAIDESFAGEVKSGRVAFRDINIDQAANRHYVQDYKLYTKSVILSDAAEGKETQWKNLDQVWTLLREPARFKAYVVEEINAYLKG